MAETEKRYPKGCPTGSAVVSTAGKLPAKYVIHAVGPVWSGGSRGEANLLASAYRAGLELAVEHGCRSMAIPALSTGGIPLPIESAARTALSTAIDFLKEHGKPELVRFVLFDAATYKIFAAQLEELG